MYKLTCALGCVLILAASVLLGANGRATTVKVSLRLVDSATGNPMGGIVRALSHLGTEPIHLPGLFDRLRGLKKTDSLAGWYVLPAGGADTELPSGRYRLQALSGLETALTETVIDSADGAKQTITIKLDSLFRPDQGGLVAGNTHLHLQGLTEADCNEYLRKVPAADGLRVLFISYLERAQADRNYTSNRYPVGDVTGFEETGVLLNNGEEHRHNFGSYGEGYGHVMFLGIKQLVKPVSLGPGITGQGFDDRPLRLGMDEARRQGGTVIWCHNANGHEGLPSALDSRLDALNVFDGSRSGTYADYYHYLNIGLRLPISTGTDWFLYDFSRVYAQVKGQLTIQTWLAALKAGRNQVTNGPFLRLKVDGLAPGETLSLNKPKKLHVIATGVGRHDFRKLQIVVNGRAILSEFAQHRGNRFEARIERDVPVDGPSWLAVRIESPEVNEFGNSLFAHSSPVYIELAGQRVFDVDSARALLARIEKGRDEIRRQGKFSSVAAQDKLAELYEESIRDLTRRIDRRGE